MRRILVPVLLLWLFTSSAVSQKQPVPFFVAYEKGKAYLIVAEAPRGMHGFKVYRKGAGDFELLTPGPVVAEKDPMMFRTLVGPDYAWISRAVKAQSEVQTMRRVQADPGSAFAFTIASLGVARATGRLFVDSTAREGEEYTYRVVYVDHANGEIRRRELKSEMESVTPSSPSGLRAEAGDGKVKLRWKYPAYAGNREDITAGFFVYRSEVGGEPQRVNDALTLRQGEEFSRVDASVENGREYSYTVRAVDVIGRLSAPAGPVSVIPRDRTSPVAPAELAAIPAEGKIAIEWGVGAEADLSHYDVYRGTSAQGEFTKINPVPVPPRTAGFVDSTVIFGPYYVYRVRSVDRSGNESRFSASVTARPIDTTPPMAPAEVSASVEGKKVGLRWKRSRSEDTRGYYVYRGFRSDDMLRMVGLPIPGDSLLFVDSGFQNRGLSPGTRYVYAVSSIDSAQNESRRVTILVSIPDTDPPAPPFNVRANTGPYGVITIGWQPSPSTDVALFRVYRSDRASTQRVLAGFRGYSINDSAVARGESYTYWVSAVDSSGNEGKKSPQVTVTSKTVYLSPAPERVEAVVSAPGVSLKWAAVDARELAGYNVYRLDRVSGTYQKLNAELLKVRSYLDSGGKPGSSYRVTSVTTSGNENEGGKPVQAVRVRGG